ncbi:MAG: ABC transporter permease [Gudongella sp.]|nr:ABC transporter permease [Gudongella sp.]
MDRIKDKTLLLFSLIGAATLLFMPLITYKPNRIARGNQFGSIEYLGAAVIIIAILWVILVALSFYAKNNTDMLVFLVSVVLFIALFWSLQLNAGDYIENPAARISLSSGFYIQMFLMYMLFSTYTGRIKEHRIIKIIGFLSIVSVLGFLFYKGLFNDFSIIKEFYSKRTQFFNNLRIHAILTFSSVVTGIIIAIPLGFLAYSKKRLEGKIMLPLSIIETIPSLSLFAIFLVPLSGLGKLAFFDSIGVSGIGWAPAYLALTLYTLLPIGRNTLTGFYSVDRNIIEAAKGMGMSKSQVLRKIELPLAFPVIFTGIRIAFIQTIGGAVLAGLVGGGGMGTFVFLGLGEASPDLILLGVLPIVFFTIILDYFLKKFEKTIRRVIYD